MVEDGKLTQEEADKTREELLKEKRMIESDDILFARKEKSEIEIETDLN